MSPCRNEDSLITGPSVREFFKDEIAAAANSQNLEARDHTIAYLVNLLTTFVRVDHEFQRNFDGVTLRPLALLYAEALEATSDEVRCQTLRQLGDLALFIAGLFSGCLNRKLVDVDYFISMGENAYGYLSDTMPDSVRGRTYSDIFEELSSKFGAFVDVLNEVSDNAKPSSDVDILRLYEIWIRTGSKNAARRLRHVGVHVTAESVSRLHH